MELPFLFVHGALVWKVLLAALTCASLATVAVIRRLTAAHRAHAEVTTLAARAFDAKLEDGDVVIRGKLVAGAASTFIQHERERADRTPVLAIEHEGERIALVGDVIVTHGSHTRSWWLRIPREIPAARAPQRFASGVHHGVTAGDEVVVSGRLARVATGATSYRKNASTWTLSEGDKLVTIAAIKPQSRSMPLGMIRWLIGACIFGSIWYGVLHHVGTRALRAEHGQELSARAIDPYGPLAIAAAMPGSRDKAFAALLHHLGDFRYFAQTEETLQLRLQLLASRGECTADLLFELGRFDEALVRARSCAPKFEPHVLLALGRYDEVASKVTVTSELGLLVAIAQGRWNDAARGVDGRAFNPPTSSAEDKAISDAGNATLRCLAALFRVWGGNRLAFDEVEIPTNHRDCSLARALALPPADRGEAIARLPWVVEREDWMTSRWRLWSFAYVSGAPIHKGDLSGFAMEHWGWSVDRGEKWLAPFILESHPDAPSAVLAALHGDLSRMAIERGDYELARREAAEAYRLDPTHSYATSRRLAVALLDGSNSFPSEGDIQVMALDEIARARRAGSIDRPWGVYPEACQPHYAEAIAQARHGDGGPLARVFAECHIYASQSNDLFGILPLVRTHRQELATMLRLHRDLMTWRVDAPFEILNRASEYRLMSYLIGDHEEAARWQQIYERHAALLADRDKLIAFMLWARL